jgi:hypothetical protein
MVRPSNDGPLCCSSWGLDFLEWRYIQQDGKSQRSSVGNHATIDEIQVTKETPSAIKLTVTGRWLNIAKFTKAIQVTPLGYSVRLEAEWAGPTELRSMWWMISVLRGASVQADALTIKDNDTSSVPLPVAYESVIPLPPGIGYPYEVTLPTKGIVPGHNLRLIVRRFGTDDATGLRYELWPVGGSGYASFFPRWVSNRMPTGAYVFDYEWRLAGMP